MSLRYALLGLLAREPASGYELARRFRGGVGRYAWHAQQSQVYPELNHLAADSLVEVVDEGPRGRRTYAITSAGRDDLHGWLTAADDRPIVRNEQVLRLFLLPCLGREDARVLLQRQAEFEPPRSGGSACHRRRGEGQAGRRTPAHGALRRGTGPAVLPAPSRLLHLGPGGAGPLTGPDSGPWSAAGQAGPASPTAAPTGRVIAPSLADATAASANQGSGGEGHGQRQHTDRPEHPPKPASSALTLLRTQFRVQEPEQVPAIHIADNQLHSCDDRGRDQGNQSKPHRGIVSRIGTSRLGRAPLCALFC